ncbi:MAG TPA: 30S ribosomal protein S12 methylthiotransferase RimO [Actinomycetes bacterium]|nr:30S ribosomal protein S12 methylthiotransferase RimO [Actinomycetes bacterium]
MTPRVSLVTLGCARNEVDSEELAGRLADAGLDLVSEPSQADAVVVNTCGFVASAKKDSIDTMLAAADLKGAGGPQAVIAVGCLAERYGTELADELTEVDAVLGFDDYSDIADRVRRVLDGERPPAPQPQDRRLLLPLAPAERNAQMNGAVNGAHASPHDQVGPASGPRTPRRLLSGSPIAPVKIASGCDRRCSFCAIPRFRGSFVSRHASDIVDEARWLASRGVREVFLVSENSTSYGKDLGDLRMLERLLPQVAKLEGIDRVRVSYLQPAEMRPSLVEAMASTPGVAPYFDISFQHASGPLLRRMRRFGDAEQFLSLIESIRALEPRAGIRSNVIVGFPGETEDDVDVLTSFLSAARLDVVGVFGYSDEDQTEAAGLSGHLSEAEIERRRQHVDQLAEQLTAERAADRLDEHVEVLVEEVDDDGAVGRAAHQGPEVDGTVTLPGVRHAVGSWVSAQVVASEGADLVAR